MPYPIFTKNVTRQLTTLTLLHIWFQTKMPDLKIQIRHQIIGLQYSYEISKATNINCPLRIILTSATLSSEDLTAFI